MGDVSKGLICHDMGDVSKGLICHDMGDVSKGYVMTWEMSVKD